ncbi:hypothetical protein [Streptomyces lancefieldiae]|uniref:Uncharacterized protein n=1 Tax=Streptomyces lancefieldiae TaxID=3075520 RepID=A0ABU3AF85_9ACTN|nr:hypothetical protein [Streptomyces sp. DSM 40712]MDT0608839.1 hypothetical protein [Streptomyces sp. DSM 40712]
MAVATRILTRAATVTGNPEATVDIDDGSSRSTARCRCCRWTRGHDIPYRNQLVTWAQEHADQCTALPG